MPPNDSIWYSYQNLPFTGTDPKFYSPDELSWVRPFEQAVERFRDQLIAHVDSNPNGLVTYFNDGITSRKAIWSTFNLYFWGEKNVENCAQLPEFSEIASRIPWMTSCGISVLEPQSEIELHHGETSGMIRCHFALKVPAELPDCGFELEHEQRSWEIGKPLLFCDARRHRAVNHTDERRMIVIVDVIKEEYSHRLPEITHRCRGILDAQRKAKEWGVTVNSPLFRLLRSWYSLRSKKRFKSVKQTVPSWRA